MAQNPTNRSFLSNNKYQFVIDRLPNLMFFLQAVNIPSISLGTVITPTPFVQMPKPGQQLSFEDLTLTYILDEDMQAWFDIYNWMTNLTNSEFPAKVSNLTSEAGKPNSKTSDAALLIKTNSNNANIKFKFADIFPTELSGVQLTSTEGHDFFTATVTFKYTYYTAEMI